MTDLSRELGWLFGLGFEKCGTTTFNAMLEGSADFLAPAGKETFFFNRHHANGLGFYHQLYAPELKPGARWAVDITPSYVRDPEAIARIKAFADSRRPLETRFMVFLRNPVYRAYSHYVHNIRLHYSRFELDSHSDAPYARSFEQEFEANREIYFTPYADRVDSLLQQFGKRHVLVLVLEEDFRSQQGLTEKLSVLLGQSVALGDFPSRTAQNRNEMSRWSTWPLVPGLGVMKPRHLVVRRQSGSARPVGTTTDARKLHRAQSQWTRELSAETAQTLFMDRFETDCARLEDLLGRRLDCWRRFRPVTY